MIYSFGYSGVYILGPILIGGTLYSYSYGISSLSDLGPICYFTPPLSDSVGLVNRTLILAVYNFPIIINLFAGGLAAQTFINSGQWRWGYGKYTRYYITHRIHDM